MDTKKTEDMKFVKKKKKMSGKSRTFMLITIPIVALFFTFNTLPLIQVSHPRLLPHSGSSISAQGEASESVTNRGAP